MTTFKNLLRLSILMASSMLLNANAASIEQGKTKASACAGCHGLDGIGLGAEFPNLAGQKNNYLIKQLLAFKTGLRVDPTMQALAAQLNKDDIENLAAYYASQPRIPEAQTSSTSIATAKASNAEFPETVYISMKKSGTMETFPAETVWKGGPNMLYNAITPDGKRVLSTSPSSDTVYIFDTENGKQLAIIKVGKAPKGVKITPDGKYAYVSNQGSAEVSVIDLASLTVIDSIKTEDGPHNVRFTRDGKTAYVTLQGGAGIGIIDTTSRKMTKVIAVPGITGPHNLDLSSDEKTAYVRDFVHHVAVLDLVSEKVTKVITVGNGHGGIDVTPDGKYAVTAAIGDNIISVIDTDTLAVKSIKVGNGPHGIRASKDSQWFYVTLTKDNAVAVVNTKSMKVDKTIAVGKFPFWVAVKGNP